MNHAHENVRTAEEAAAILEAEALARVEAHEKATLSGDRDDLRDPDERIRATTEELSRLGLHVEDVIDTLDRLAEYLPRFRDALDALHDGPAPRHGRAAQRSPYDIGDTRGGGR